MTTGPSPPRLSDRPRRRAAISLTPLIDVVFILLVFFMLATSFLDWRSIPLRTAGAAGEAAGMEGALLVEVTSAGPRLSGELVDLPALRARVAERVSARPEQRVLVRPGPAADMQAMVATLDALDAAGARELALVSGTSGR